MPLSNNKVPVLFGKRLRFRQFAHLQPDRLPENNTVLDVEDCLSIAMDHMHMNGKVFIAVEKEHISSISNILGILILVLCIRSEVRHGAERRCLHRLCAQHGRVVNGVKDPCRRTKHDQT